MLIGQASDLISTRLGFLGISDANKPDRREIIAQMEVERSALMMLLTFNGVIFNGALQVKIDKDIQELPDVYYGTYQAQAIQQNPITKRCFVPVPLEYETFNNINGIREIRWPADINGPVFWIQKAGAASAYSQLESANLLGAIGVEIIGQTAYLNNVPPPFIGSAPQFVMAPRLTSLQETDVLPSSSELTSMMIENTVKAFAILKAAPDDETMRKAAQPEGGAQQ